MVMESRQMVRRQQLRVLSTLDVARTQFYHFMAIVIAGMGFFTDAYDFFSISLVIDIFSYQYYKKGEMDRGVKAAMSSIALCGAVPGQLIFGWLGDKMGRKRIYGITLVLMVVTSLASGLSFSKRDADVITVLCFFRFWLGVSIGGDYPLSATIMSEYANKRRRGAFIAAVFSMQGFGNLAAGIVGMVVSAAFRNSRNSNSDYVWRIVLMFGAVPATFTYYWRMKMPETARYTALVAKDAKKVASDMSTVLNMHIVPEDEAVDELARHDQYGLFSMEFLHRHGVHLLGTSACWLALDVTFYSLNLFMKEFFESVKLLKELQSRYNVDVDDGNKPFSRMILITALHTLFVLCFSLPGYFFSVAFMDRIGRVRIQLLGFGMMSAFMLGLAIPDYDYWCGHKSGFAAMYGLTSFFANFGPNTTTFIIPAEIFPARLRSTCHGISGAFGKIGAIIGVFAFVYTENHNHNHNRGMLHADACSRKNNRGMLFALVVCNLFGLGFTFLLPESKGKALEEITGEMEEPPQPEQEAAAVAAAEYVHVVPV